MNTAVEFIPFSTMDFGTEENPKCGICGSAEPAYYKNGVLQEDVICKTCNEKYDYDEDKDGYTVNPEEECCGCIEFGDDGCKCKCHLEDESTTRICGECKEEFYIEYEPDIDFYEYYNEVDNICYCDEDCYNKWKESKEWEQSYACDEVMTKTYVMVDEWLDWWNYVVEFHTEDEQKAVYKENKNGRTLLPDKRLINNYDDDEKQDKVRLVDYAYELKKSEGYVSYY